MPTKVTKHIGATGLVPAGTPAGDIYATPNLFDNWISAQNLVTQDIWVEALVYQSYVSADIANMEMHPLAYDADHYCLVKPAPGKGVNELDPSGAYGYGTVGVELTIQANTTPRLAIGAGVFMEGFRIRITEPSAPSTTGQYGISVQRKDNSGNFPLTVPGALRQCRILSEVTNAGNGAVYVGLYSSAGDVEDNVFFQSAGSGAFVRNISNTRVRRNTFVRSGTSTGTAISSNATAPTYEDNAFSNCTGVPMTLTADASTNIRNNFTDVAKTNAQAGLTYAAGLIVSSSDARPVAAGPLINAASVAARGTRDGRGNYRGTEPDVGALQLNPPATPTGTITSQPAPDGQSQRFSGTTSSATSGTYTLTGSNGGVTAGPASFAITNDAFDFTVTGLAPGNYAPTLTVTGPGGTAGVTGTSAFSIMGVDGGGDLPGDAPASSVASVAISPSAATIAGGATQQFSATVSGTNSPSQSVTWTASLGTVSASGLYTAPAQTAAHQYATVTATSVQDAGKSATANIAIPGSAPPSIGRVAHSRSRSSRRGRRAM